MDRGAALGVSPRTLAVLGLAGSVLVAASACWVGAIPTFFRGPHTAVISVLPIAGALPRVAFYAGLAALVLAWLWLGRLLLAGPVAGIRMMAAWWVLPLLVAPPIGSRDLWAYAAQGQLIKHGLDPYRVGPSALPGSFSAEVSHRWLDAPSPYGPLWLALCRLVADTGANVWVSMIVLRLLAAIGFGLLAWALPVLARRAGGRADVAVWLVLANPLVLVLGVGGGHNDVLMIGLVAAALVCATAPGASWRSLGLGVVIAAAAVAVKAPAAIGVAFLVPLWLPLRPGRSRREVVIASVAVAAGAVAVFTAITELSGLGWGWFDQLDSSTPVVTWLSLPTLLAICVKLLQGQPSTAVDSTMRGLRTAGTVLSAVLLAGFWFVALRGRAWQLLALSLLTVVLLSPGVEPWYFVWALAIVASFVAEGALWWIASASIALVLMVRPDGTPLQMTPVVIAFVAGAAVVGWLALARRPSPVRSTV